MLDLSTAGFDFADQAAGHDLHERTAFLAEWFMHFRGPDRGRLSDAAQHDPIRVLLQFEAVALMAREELRCQGLDSPPFPSAWHDPIGFLDVAFAYFDAVANPSTVH